MTMSAPTVKERVLEELHRYLIVSVYLYVCFSVVILYDATQPQARGEHLWHLSVAIGKALIVGKFVLIGDLVVAGRRLPARTVLQRIAWRVLLLTGILVVLTTLEHVIVGAVHGRAALQTLEELFVESLPGTCARTLLMLLFLTPLVTINEADRALGRGSLWRLVLSPPDRAPD